MEGKTIKKGETLLRLAEVKAKVGLGHNAIYRKIKVGAFPRPLQLGSQCVRWKESDIDAWIAALPTTTDRAA